MGSVLSVADGNVNHYSAAQGLTAASHTRCAT